MPDTFNAGPPPRPRPRPGAEAPLIKDELAVDLDPSPATPAADAAAAPAELDQGTRKLLADAIARAFTAELGRVRISSIAPPAPRSSIRAAAKGTAKVGKWGSMILGALAVVGQVIVWTMKPEYAGPIAQAVKLIASVVASIAGGAPSGDTIP